MSPSVQTAPPTGISTVIGDGFFTPESPPDEIHLAGTSGIEIANSRLEY